MQKKFCDMTTLRIPADASSGRTPCKVLLPLFVLYFSQLRADTYADSHPGDDPDADTVRASHACGHLRVYKRRMQRLRRLER